MIELGKYNRLRACRVADQGMILCDDDSGQEVLLPAREEPEDLLVDDRLEVFIYKDGADNLIATTREPRIKRGEFAYLKVVEVTRYGAFLDWGLTKDLLVPFSEQARKMTRDNWYIVYCYLDEITERLVASSRTDRFLKDEPEDLQRGDEVELLIGPTTDLGVNVIINDKHKGLIFHKDLYQTVEIGERRRGYIKKVKPEGKIDVSLQPPGYQRVPGNAGKILTKLEENQGFLPLTDKSDPARIHDELEMSKKTFKKAIGALYKQRRIRIETDGIYLVDEEK